MRLTARITGLCYLGLALTGALGFLTIRPRLFADGDPVGTLANLTAHPTMAAAGVALELGVVLAQALAAACFYRLFHPAEPVAAAGIAAFGLVNSVAIMGSAAAIGTAAQIAQRPTGDAAGTVQLLYLLSDNFWTAGAIFFGLWLIPMGIAVLRTGLMPAALGWILIPGGVLYVVSAFYPHDLLAVPASVGEFWMIAYLLIFGVRRAKEPATAPR